MTYTHKHFISFLNPNDDDDDDDNDDDDDDGDDDDDNNNNKVKGKNVEAIPLQAWTGPEGSRNLRFLDLKTIGTLRW